MDPETILHELTFAKELPREALLAATARRDEMVPLFLQEIEDFLATPSEERREPSPLFFIFHQLGEWREKSAYLPLTRFLRCPRRDVKWVLGDCTTETAHRVVISVFDSNPEPVMEVIRDADADEFVRGRMFDVLAILTLRKEVDRDVVERFLRDCFTELQPQGQCFVWDGWQGAVAMLGLHDLVPFVKQAFDRKFIAPEWLRFKDFKGDLNGDKGSPLARFHQGDSDYSPFGIVAEEMASYVFDNWSDGGGVNDSGAEDELALANLWQQPMTNPHKNLGRNDPCPCGSGRKFKKCCLQA